MRVIAVLLLLIFAPAMPSPGQAETTPPGKAAAASASREIFARGPATCAALAPSITAMTLGKCKWRVDFKKRAFFGSCSGSLSVDDVEVAFTASGEMTRLEEKFADNTAPLGFIYPNLVACSAETKLVKSVQNCRISKDGLGRYCDVCIRLGKLSKTLCYATKGSVKLTSKLPPGLTLTPAGLVKGKAK